MRNDECPDDYVEQCFYFTIDSTDQQIQPRLCSTKSSILTRDVCIYIIVCVCACMHVNVSLE